VRSIAAARPFRIVSGAAGARSASGTPATRRAYCAAACSFAHSFTASSIAPRVVRSDRFRLFRFQLPSCRQRRYSVPLREASSYTVTFHGRKPTLSSHSPSATGAPSAFDLPLDAELSSGISRVLE
jgi:hypothetical protein